MWGLPSCQPLWVPMALLLVITELVTVKSTWLAKWHILHYMGVKTWLEKNTNPPTSPVFLECIVHTCLQYLCPRHCMPCLTEATVYDMPNVARNRHLCCRGTQGAGASRPRWLSLPAPPRGQLHSVNRFARAGWLAREAEHTCWVWGRKGGCGQDRGVDRGTDFQLPVELYKGELSVKQTH